MLMDMERFLEEFPPRREDLQAKMPLSSTSQNNLATPLIKLDMLDLHGYKREEARELVLETIASVPAHCRARLPISHGKGLHSKDFPVLRGVIQEIASRHARVERSHFAKQNEGGSGVSIFWIKKCK